MITPTGIPDDFRGPYLDAFYKGMIERITIKLLPVLTVFKANCGKV